MNKQLSQNLTKINILLENQKENLDKLHMLTDNLKNNSIKGEKTTHETSDY